MRIEDDILVTESGCEMLTDAAPKEIDVIKELMNKSNYMPCHLLSHKPMKNYQLYFKDICEAMSAVQGFVKEMDFSAFAADDKTSSAVVYKLEIIGESAKNIPDTIQELYPQVPWRQMIEMRDQFIHTYFDIDYAAVWKTIKDMIPPLQPIIAQILEDMEKETNDE